MKTKTTTSAAKSILSDIAQGDDETISRDAELEGLDIFEDDEVLMSFSDQIDFGGMSFD